jgi:hypothetical protein
VTHRVGIKSGVLAREAAAIALGCALSLSVSGYQFGRSNHLVYLPDPLHSFDPTLLANDWFTTQTLQYHSVFGLLTHWLLQLNFLEGGFLLGYLLTVVALHGAWRVLVKQMGGTRESYLISVLLVQLAAGGTSLGSYHFLQDSAFLPSNVAAVAMLWGICAMAAGRWALAGLAIGTAGLIHLNYAVAGGLLWAAISLWQRPWQSQFRSWLLGSALAAGLVAANMLPAVGRLTSPPGMPFAEFVEIYAKLRHPHHYDPLSWHPALWLCFLIPTLAAGWIVLARRKDFLRPAPKTLFRVAITLLVLLTAAFLFAGVIFISERLIQLSLFRFSIFVSLLACIVIAWWVWDYRPRQWPVKFALLLLVPLMAAVCLAVPVLLPGSVAANFVTGQWMSLAYILAVCGLVVLVVVMGTKLPPAGHATVAALTIASIALGWNTWLGVNFVPDDNPAYIQLTHWAAAHTDKNAIFLVPPNEQSMRVDGRRAIVVNFKAVPQLSGELAEWRRRMEKVLGQDLRSLPRPMPQTLSAMAAIYNERPAEDLRQLAGDFGARYIVTAQPKPPLGTPINPVPHAYFVYDVAAPADPKAGTRTP